MGGGRGKGFQEHLWKTHGQNQGLVGSWWEVGIVGLEGCGGGEMCHLYLNSNKKYSKRPREVWY